jgi:hypothetical protein
MGVTESKEYPSVERFYETLSMYLKLDEPTKKEIHKCAAKLYKKLSLSHHVTVHSELVCYILAMKQLFAYDVPTADKYIKKALTLSGIDTKDFYKDELRILLLYPNLCDDIGKRHPRLAAEVDEENIIKEELGIKRKSKKKSKKSKTKNKKSRKSRKRHHKK